MPDEVKKGQCYCGATRVEVAGLPAIEGFCHCKSCQKYHGAPFQAFAAWPNEKVTISGSTITSEVSPQTRRVSCANCGGVVMTKKPETGMCVVFPSTLSGSGHSFLGDIHIFYGARSMDVGDGLPKFEDLPKEFGGSGNMIPEPSSSGWLNEPATPRLFNEGENL